MIQIRYTSILLWSVHDKAARAAHLPVRRPSSLLPRVLAGRGNLLASLLPPVLEDLAPCGRPLTNPEARRSLPVPIGPPGGAPQATLRVGLHDKSATPALGLSANDAPRARETGTCARREVGVSQQKGKCDRTSRGHRGLSLSLSFARRARLVKAEWRAGTKPEGSTRVFSRRAKEASVARQNGRSFLASLPSHLLRTSLPFSIDR